MTIQSAIAALSKDLGEAVSLSKSDLDIHGRSESYFPDTPPDAVVYPRSTEEVSRAVSICAEHGCPVIPWGTGTALEGHATPVRGGVTLDLSKMNRLLAVNQDDMDCVVQPGLTRQELNEELRATGLFFPVDPGANAALGGMAATRASGTTTVRYGNMRQNILALEVVLADGRVIRTGSRARKTAAGYDLTGLFVGSEGTLGIITELTLRLHGQPEAISAAVCAFPDVDAAVQTVIAAIQMGIPMARMELLDADCARCFNDYADAGLPEKPHLFLEFHGSETGVREQAETFGEIAGEFGSEGFRWSDRAEERNRLWKMRHEGYYAIIGAVPGGRGLVTDICVPISRLSEAIAETAEDIRESGMLGPIVGHVGDGNFHSVLVLRPDHPEDVETAKALGARMAERALRMGGTVTGEHGIGTGKIPFMRKEHGDAVDVMAALKRALDPANIMNPGKMVEIN